MRSRSSRPAWSLLVIAIAVWPGLARGGERSGLVARWAFDRAHVNGAAVKASAGELDGRVVGTARPEQGPDALAFDGTTASVVVAEGAPPRQLPTRAMTAAAWIAVDKPIEWGGILGFVQDNGGFEKGWILGTHRSQFIFALSTKGANDGDGKLTYLHSTTTFEPGRWYHVAGTFDGAVQRIYVNGKLEASSKAQSGDILYPKSSFLEIAAYHDSNERHRLPCRIHEVELYARALSPDEVGAACRARLARFPRPLELADGPYIRLLDAHTARLTFRTAEPGTVAVYYGRGSETPRRAVGLKEGTEHEVRLEALEPDATYHYRIRWTGRPRGAAPTRTAVSGAFQFDSTTRPAPHRLTGGPSPYPADALTPLYERTARWLIETSGVRRGFCLVLGCGDGRLAFELAKRTDLRVIGVEEDAPKAAAARQALDRAGAYGVRVAVRSGPLSALPSRFANLIVSDRTLTTGELPPSADEVLRLLRPYGGVACLGQPASFAKLGNPLDAAAARRWLSAKEPWELLEDDGLWVLLRRGAVPGSGEWTHMYADAGNSACSGDRLAHGPMRLQWFGRPGPRLMIDRHHRTMAPLAKDGRLFIPAADRILAIDAYNGTQLWDMGITGSQRLAAPKDTSYLALADDLLYVAARDRCVALEVGTGRIAKRFAAPQLVEGKHRVWGYVATVDSLLLGSGRKEGASLTRQSRHTVSIQYGDHKDVATSDYLFCLDRHSGKRLWDHRSGVIVDPAIGISGGRIYFVESTNPKAAEDPDGRMRLSVSLGQGSRLVALDARTGRLAWKRPVDLRAIEHVLHLVAARGTVLIVGSRNEHKKVHYDLLAFDAASGRPLWQRKQNNNQNQGGTHGEQVHHPAVVGDVVHAEPFAYHLRTGEPVAGWAFNRGGHGCGTISASGAALFYRAGNPTMFDLRTRRAAKLSRVSRPGCWINIVPACGLILIPEASSGCSCPYPLQASMAFMPQPASSQ